MQGAYAAWWFWINVGQILGYIGLGAYVAWSNRQKATRASIAALHRRIDDQERERETRDRETLGRCALHKELISTIQVETRSAPNHDDLGAVYDKVSEVKGSVDKLTGTLTGLVKQVDLLVEHHLRGGRK